MTITLRPELDEQLRERAAQAGLPVDAYVERLVEETAFWNLEHDQFSTDAEAELEEVREAVAEATEQIRVGLDRPAKEVLDRLAAKYGFSD